MSIAWHEIRDHLMHSSSNLHFQRSFDAVRRAQAALTPFRDPAALLDGLHGTTGDQGQKNLILSALVRAAQGDGPASDCALTLLLLALWPGLDAIRRRSRMITCPTSDARRCAAGSDASGLEGWRKLCWKEESADFCAIGRFGRVGRMFPSRTGAGACACMMKIYRYPSNPSKASKREN